MDSTTSVEFYAEPWRNPNFWHELHVQDPARFVFGDQIGLILADRTITATIRRISIEAHRNFVKARNDVARTRKYPKSLPKVFDFFKDTLTATHFQSDIMVLFDQETMWKIVSDGANNLSVWNDTTILERMSERFERLAKKTQLRMGKKTVEMLARSFIVFVRNINAQILHLQKINLNQKSIPSTVNYYLSSSYLSNCFFDEQNMLRRLKRSEHSANLVLEIIHARPGNIIDFVFDPSFQFMFSNDFKKFINKWLDSFRHRLNFFNGHKSTALRALPIGSSISADQIPEFLQHTFNFLFNDETMELFKDTWQEFVMRMIWLLKLVKLEKEPEEMNAQDWKVEEFLSILISGNRDLGTCLSSVYYTKRVEEQRVVLAQLFRFVLTFISDLIRFVFDVKINKEGSIEKIVYDGHFETVGDGGEVNADLQNIVTHSPSVYIDNSWDKSDWQAQSPDTDSSSSSSSYDFRPKSILKNPMEMSHDESPVVITDLSYKYVQCMSAMNTINNWNATLSPMPIAGNNNPTAMSSVFLSPPTTPEPTPPLFNTPNPFSPNSSMTRGRQMSSNNKPRRRGTPQARRRAPSPDSSSEDEDYERIIITIDNNSNESEQDYLYTYEEEETDYLYEYPIIPTAIGNNETD